MGYVIVLLRSSCIPRTMVVVHTTGAGRLTQVYGTGKGVLLTFMLTVLLLAMKIPVLGAARIGTSHSSELYPHGGKVISLNSTSVRQAVFNADRAWLVEFFAHWCGHCIRFAPTYKHFATEVHDWRNVVTIAALDCADEANTDVCSEFDINYYPKILFFPPHYPQFDPKRTMNQGTEIQKDDQDTSFLKYQLIDRLEQHYPLLLSYTNYTGNGPHALDELWYGVSHHHQHRRQKQPGAVVMIFENATSYLGKEVALRLSLRKSIKVYRFGQPNDIYKLYTEEAKRAAWPAVLYYGRDQVVRSVSFDNEDVVSVCEKVLKLLGIIENEDSASPMARSVDASTAAGDPEKIHHKDVVSMNDLLHTVRFTLHTEIAIPRIIQGEKLQSLRDYLKALLEFLPLKRRKTGHFLRDLHFWTLEKRSIQEPEFRHKLEELEQAHFPWEGVDLHHWYDCKSTVHGRRGYTCGLWRLFHTLIVTSIERNATRGPMTAIDGYVKEFFGCKECGDHFDTMAARDKALNETNSSPTKQALWLWRAHNEVNLRTKGTPSEDPGYPKQSYPTRKHCPECFDHDGRYIEPRVLDYLKKVYTPPHADRLQG